MGKIKVTRKVTVTHKVQVRQQIRQQVHIPAQEITYTRTSTPSQISNAPSQSALNSAKAQLNTAQNQLKAAMRRRTSLPTGMYSAPVETLFNALGEHRKPEEVEDKAMYDVFISHASEDKAGFVDPLVESLQNDGIRVWYDTTELQWGKSLREQIDNGIKRSKFAILVLSKSFFAKKWPQRELDGILAKETVSGAIPLPIWHELSYEEVYELSPTLAGLYSFSTDKYSIPDICKALKLILEKEPVEL